MQSSLTSNGSSKSKKKAVGRQRIILDQVQGTAFGKTLQLIKLTALYSIFVQNQLNLILACNVRSFDVIKVLPASKQKCLRTSFNCSGLKSSNFVSSFVSAQYCRSKFGALTVVVGILFNLFEEFYDQCGQISASPFSIWTLNVLL